MPMASSWLRSIGQSASLALRPIWRPAAGDCRRRLSSLIVESPVPDVELPRCNYAHLALSRVDECAHRPALIEASASGAADRSLSFADVRTLSYNVASGLVRHGVRPGCVLALFLHNCPEFVIAQLGAMIAGVTVTLVNPNFTVSEVAHQLRHANAVAVVTQRNKFHTVASAARQADCLKDIYIVDEAASGTHHFSELTHDSADMFEPGRLDFDPATTVAILPYSSGTTGLPKGVELTHLNISVNLLQYNRTVQPQDLTGRYCMVLPMYHMFGHAMAGQALYTGSTSVLMQKFNPELFLRAADSYKINMMHLVPPLVLFLLNHPLVQQFDLSSISNVYSGAAPLGRESQDRLREMFRSRYGTEIHIDQLFGLTETSPITHGPEPLSVRQGDTTGTIGAPVCNQLTRVVHTETGEDLGPNEEGELVIKGPQVMKGYLNNEEATRSCIKDGWFFTGDIAVYDENRYFRIVDRLKELIKVKGSQVAPAELEALLLQHPAVLDCGVIGRPDERAGELPCAFVVPRPGHRLTEEDVKNFVAERVTSYKRLDGGVLFADEIPRNPSGKILRRLLRDQLRR